MIRYTQIPGTKPKPERKAKPVGNAKKKPVKGKTRKGQKPKGSKRSTILTGS